MVDKQGARLFYFHLGELREQEGVLGESVKRTKRGGGSQAAGRRGGPRLRDPHAQRGDGGQHRGHGGRAQEGGLPLPSERVGGRCRERDLQVPRHVVPQGR